MSVGCKKQSGALNNSRWDDDLIPIFPIRVLSATVALLLILFGYRILSDSMFLARAQNGFYSIHVSSFRDRKSAEMEVSNYEKRGLQAFYRYELVQGRGNWYRIYIGRFDSRKKAVHKAEELKKSKILSYYAVRALEQAPRAKPSEADQFDYYVKAGTFSSKDKAQSEIRRLRREGFTSLLREDTVSGKKRYRVYIGTFKDEKEAQRRGRELFRNGTISYYVAGEIDQIFRTRKRRPLMGEPDKVTEEVPERKVTEKPREEKIEEPPEQVLVVEVEEEEIPRAEERREVGLEQVLLPRKSPFSLSLKAGAFISGSAHDFRIIQTQAGGTRVFSFTGEAAQVGLTSSLRIYNNFSLYGSVEYVFGDDLDGIFLSVGPKLTFELSEWLYPYVKGGGVYGDLEWDGAPGEFEDDFGWEAGAGVDFLKSQFKIGFDLLYRDIEFDFKTRGAPGVTASDRVIDFSGVSLLVSLTYYF